MINRRAVSSAPLLFGVLISCCRRSARLLSRDSSGLPLGLVRVRVAPESASTAPFLRSSSIRRSARGSMSLSLRGGRRFNGTVQFGFTLARADPMSISDKPQVDGLRVDCVLARQVELDC